MFYYFQFFTQLFLKVEPCESESAGTKAEFDTLTLKVILGHSFCKPFTGRQRVEYRHIILLA